MMNITDDFVAVITSPPYGDAVSDEYVVVVRKPGGSGT
jgi:hypothetical protein